MADKNKTNERVKKLRYGFIRMTPHILGNIVYKFDALEQFRHFTISAIEREKKSIEKRFEKDTNGLTDEEIREYFDWYGENYFMVEDVFQKITLNSFIIILYSYVESGLNSLCTVKFSDARMEQKKKNKQAADEGKEPQKLLELMYKDMKGKGIKRSRSYLEIVFGVSFDSVKEEWDEINGLAKLRNAIVHDNSIARDNILKDGKIKKHIEENRIGIADHGENTYGRIIIKPGYLDAMLLAAVEFFKNIEV